MHNVRKPILDVLEGRVPEVLPVWLMRQAGRYLPEYREIRAKSKDFLNMALTPELAIEITLQPIRRFDMDAAILFADILLVPLALGQGLTFREGEGPVLERVENESDLDGLRYDADKVAGVFAALRGTKPLLPPQTTLIGFCGAPWTVACYMIDGNSRDNFARTKEWTTKNRSALDRLITILTDASVDYLSAQIEAGAEVIQIFDSWSGLLTGVDFNDLIIKPTRNLIERIKNIHPHIPIIGFPRLAGQGYLPYIQQTGVDAMSIDPFVHLDEAQKLKSIKPLQGNLDPTLLVEGGKTLDLAIDLILNHLGPNHIFNLGHGVVPQTPPDHVAQLVKRVRQFKI